MRSYRTDSWLRRVNALCLISVAGACGGGPTDPVPINATPVQAYEEFWRQFDANYSYFNYKGYDWKAAKSAYAAEAAAAPDITSLVPVLKRMVEPLRDLHISFTSPSGSWQPAYTSTYKMNFHQGTWLLYASRAGYKQVAANLGYGSFGDVGYILIGSWNPATVTTDRFDNILEDLRGTRALILDVRTNAGGDDQLALDFAARFLTASRVAQYAKFRDGPNYSDFGPLLERRFGPRGSWHYTKPVYLLVGRYCASSNETFILGLKGLPNVTVLGDTTAGASGNPREFSLGGGWKFRVPRWIAYTPDMRVIEWNGVAPDLVVPIPAGGFDGVSDPVLDVALLRATQ